MQVFRVAKSTSRAESDIHEPTAVSGGVEADYTVWKLEYACVFLAEHLRGVVAVAEHREKSLL